MWERSILVIVALAPMFILANNINSDEIAKSSIGIFGATIVAIIAAIMRSRK